MEEMTARIDKWIRGLLFRRGRDGEMQGVWITYRYIKSPQLFDGR